MSHFSNVGRRLYGESPLTIFYLVSLSIQVPQNRGKQCCSIVLSFNTIILSATTGFIFPNDHSQQQWQQQSCPRIYSDPQNPNLFFFCIIRIGTGNTGSGGGGYDYQRQQLHTFTFGGTHSGSTTPENAFSSPDSLRSSVSDAPSDYRQYHNEYDDSNLADETHESLEKNPLAQSLCSGSIQNYIIIL